MSAERTFAVLYSHLRRQDPTFRCGFRVGPASHFPAARDYAYCTAGPPPTIVVSPKILRASAERQIGLIAHELGHAVHMHCGRYRHSERDADTLAENLLGLRISYDANDVQTIGAGQRPRPDYLPK